MNFPSVSQFSIAKGTGGATPPEMYIPLWWISGGSVGVNGSSNSATSSTAHYWWLLKGGAFGSLNNSANLHTLNSSWNPSQKYALEATLNVNSTGTVYVALYDMTTSQTQVSTSLISTTSTTPIVVRSSQFTLTPGHVYGVSMYVVSTSTIGNITDASLIVFPS